MYYIEQVEGELVKAAHRVWQAVKDGDMETAYAIYRQYVGEPPTDDIVWWTYNASHQIKAESKLTTADYAQFYGDSEQCAKAAARLAQRRVGGKWEVFYEY